MTVTILDIAGNPLAGIHVVFDFSEMTDVRLCTALVEGVGKVDCSGRRIRAITDASGQVTLTVLGAGTNSVETQGHRRGAGQIYADGILIGTFTSPLVDQDGAVGGNGVTGRDLALSAADVLRFILHGEPYQGRSDFSQDGRLTSLDLSIHAALVNASALGRGSASGCADVAGPQLYCP